MTVLFPLVVVANVVVLLLLMLMLMLLSIFFTAVELHSDLFFFADVTSDLRNTNVLNILTKAT